MPTASKLPSAAAVVSATDGALVVAITAAPRSVVAPPPTPGALLLGGVRNDAVPGLPLGGLPKAAPGRAYVEARPLDARIFARTAAARSVMPGNSSGSDAQASGDNAVLLPLLPLLLMRTLKGGVGSGSDDSARLLAWLLPSFSGPPPALPPPPQPPDVLLKPSSLVLGCSASSCETARRRMGEGMMERGEGRPATARAAAVARTGDGEDMACGSTRRCACRFCEAAAAAFA